MASKAKAKTALTKPKQSLTKPKQSLTKPNQSLTKPNQSLTSIVDGLKKNLTGSLVNNYQKPEYTAVTDPKLRSASELNQQMGTDITYDRDAIEKIYKDATNASFKTDMQQQQNAERNYYTDMSTAQNTLMDTLRQQQGQAVTSGVNSGMQAASALSTMLGTSQAAAKEATTLAQDRQKLGNTYAADLKNDTKSALDTANATGQALATLSRQLYNDDIQQKTAELSYNQGINTDYAGNQSAYTNSLASLLSNIANAGTGVYNNNQSAVAQIQAAVQNASGTRDAYKATADATKYAANLSAGQSGSSGSTAQSSAQRSTANVARTNYNGKSIVDGLKSAGIDSSYAYRTQLAQLNGIQGYNGSSSQNTLLLNLLKNGSLRTS